MTEFTGPGVYDLPADIYHADPVPGGSLSSSGARKLLPPNCPAIYRHERQNPPASTDVFDFGTAAHTAVLGTGQPIGVVNADDWRTKAAKERAEALRAEGLVPLLAKDAAKVNAMADALRKHPIAGALFRPGNGKAEQTLIWQDEPTGVWCRAMLDWLPTGGRVVADYKSAASANPDEFARAAARYGYAQQAAWYLDGVRTLGLDADPAFVFVVQEKTAPYLVTVIELDAAALHTGDVLNRRAREVYAECTATDTWPTYTDDVALVSLPRYYTDKHLEYLP